MYSPNVFINSAGEAECSIHGTSYINDKTRGKDVYYYDCLECIKTKYNNAKICGCCGDREGFSLGTGDCGCYG